MCHRSYTNFSFTWSNNPPSSSGRVAIPSAAQGLTAFSIEHSVTVTNAGSRTSDVVALAFIVRVLGSPVDTPLRKLFGFERFSAVAPGESRTAYFAPDAHALGVVGQSGDRVLQPGEYAIECGSVEQPVRRVVELVGEPLLVERGSEWVKAATATTK